MSAQPQRRKRTAIKRRPAATRRPAAPRRVKRAAPAVRTHPHSVPKAESGALMALGSTLGGIGGEMIAGPPGAAIGSFLGGKLGHLVSQVSGFGNYHVDQNTLLDGGMPVPQIVNSINKGTTIVRHCEYIGDVTSSVNFTIDTYPLNPGMAVTFPWLSQIASAYEQYRWRGLIFEFRTTSSNALLSSSTSTALGTVIMGTQYNVDEAQWTDKRTMLNHEYSNSVDPSRTGVHLIECKDSLTTIPHKFTRSGLPTSNNGSAVDLLLYDLGNFSIATVGMQVGGGVLGELWVSYEVELIKQQFNQLGYMDSFATIYGVPTNSSPLAGTATPRYGVQGSSLGGFIISDAPLGDLYNFPPNNSSGVYIVEIQWNGESAVIGYPTITYSNCSPINPANEVFNSPVTGSSSGQMNTFLLVQLTAPNASLRIGADGSLPVSCYNRLYVSYAGNTYKGY